MLDPAFKKFLDDLVVAFSDQDIRANIYPEAPTCAGVALWSDDDGEDDWAVNGGNFYVGGCAAPGLRLEWLGEHDFETSRGTERHAMVYANGTVISAFPKCVTAWAVGL